MTKRSDNIKPKQAAVLNKNTDNITAVVMMLAQFNVDPEYLYTP